MWQRLKDLRDEYLDLGIQNSIDYEKFAIISIVYNSTKIEGCTLDEGDTEILIKNGLTAKGKPLKDHLMIKDHFDSFMFLKEQAILKRKISVQFIQEVGGLVKKHTGGLEKTILGNFDSSKGDLRLTQAYTDTRYFPNHTKVHGLLLSLCESINSRIDNVSGEDILKLAADMHYNLVNIHPFADGNGRVSRLFMNYICLYHDEPLIKIFTEDRKEYLDALHRTDTEKDINIFTNFICSQQIKFYEIEIKKFHDMDKHPRL